MLQQANKTSDTKCVDTYIPVRGDNCIANMQYTEAYYWKEHSLPRNWHATIYRWHIWRNSIRCNRNHVGRERHHSGGGIHITKGSDLGKWRSLPVGRSIRHTTRVQSISCNHMTKEVSNVTRSPAHNKENIFPHYNTRLKHRILTSSCRAVSHNMIWRSTCITSTIPLFYKRIRSGPNNAQKQTERKPLFTKSSFNVLHMIRRKWTAWNIHV